MHLLSCPKRDQLKRWTNCNFLSFYSKSNFSNIFNLFNLFNILSFIHFFSWFQLHNFSSWTWFYIFFRWTLSRFYSFFSWSRFFHYIFFNHIVIYDNCIIQFLLLASWRFPLHRVGGYDHCCFCSYPSQLQPSPAGQGFKLKITWSCFYIDHIEVWLMICFVNYQEWQAWLSDCLNNIVLFS